MQFDFTNKNILITGGSRGIGRACAQLFAGMNANVIITYNFNSGESQRTIDSLKNKGNHSSYQLDITDANAIEQVFNQLIKKYDHLDVLVNNAGVYLPHSIMETSYAEWQQTWNEMIATNLTGVSNLCYFAANHMKQNGGGKIVNISSRGAFRGEPHHVAYGASKAGLNSLSQSLAVALAPHNIIVVAIAPGFVETDMAADYLAGAAGEAVKKQSPLGRVATAGEVARLVAVIASDGFEFMTGGIVDLNGASYLRS